MRTCESKLSLETGMHSDIAEITANFNLPLQAKEYQIKAFGSLKDKKKSGLFFWVGLGKTFVSTLLGLHHAVAGGATMLMVVVPPALVVQWKCWFESISFSDGSPLSVVCYRGSPAERKEMNIKEANILIVPSSLFIRDYNRFEAELYSRDDIFVIYDEAHEGLRKTKNKTWKFFNHFVANKMVVLLTATPVGNPEDVYALCKIMNPAAYRNRGHFDNLHIETMDFWGGVTSWRNVDILRDNLYANAYKLEASDEVQLPDVVYTQVKYELAPQHAAMYKKLRKEQLLVLESGETMDVVQAQKMFHLLQQMVTAPVRLGVPVPPSSMLSVLLSVFNEDVNKKLVVFANYQKTNESILTAFSDHGIQAVGAWSVYTREQQDANIKKWMEDPDTMVLVGHFKSIGVGINLQHYTNRCAFVEMPLASREFYQCVGRIHRQGQVARYCDVKVMTAINTIQEYLYSAIKAKDDVINQIMRNKKCLRDLLA